MLIIVIYLRTHTQCIKTWNTHFKKPTNWLQFKPSALADKLLLHQPFPIFFKFFCLSKSILSSRRSIHLPVDGKYGMFNSFCFLSNVSPFWSSFCFIFFRKRGCDIPTSHPYLLALTWWALYSNLVSNFTSIVMWANANSLRGPILCLYAISSTCVIQFL